MNLNSIAALFVLMIGAYFRLLELSFPNAVVFDEIHYGSICSLYFKKQFHFDKQPPLFKILLYVILPRKFLQSDLWMHVGQQFSSNYNLLIIRILPAICGVGLIVLAYKTVRLLKYSQFAALICAMLITFDNGLILQCRLMTADAFQHFLLLLCLYQALKNTALSVVISHFCLGCAISTHWSSLSLFPIVFMLTFLKSWQLFTDVRIPLLQALIKGFLFLISCVCIPVVYFVIIAFHMSFLSHSGVHDTLMSSAFRSSLFGGLKSNADFVSYGSQLYLRGTGDIKPYGTCYLKSTSEIYPIVYSDGRGSSAQQIVSCCHFSSRNSLFEIAHPIEYENLMPVQNGDIVLLKHVSTGRLLSTHDVAAPISRHRQEVCCIVERNMSYHEKFEWKVKILNGNINNDQWLNLFSHVLLQHVGTDAYLTASGVLLPSWGRGCNEMVGDLPDHAEFEPTSWNAEVVTSKETDEKSIFYSQFTIYDRTLEYIYKSFFFEGPESDHRFASEWSDWLFGSTVIAYWKDKKSNSQIYFTGNVVSWVGGIIISIFLLAYCIASSILCQMKFELIIRSRLKQMQFVLLVFGLSYISHLCYYIFTNMRPLFVYQYLPCVVYLHILQACAIEEFCFSGNLLFFCFNRKIPSGYFNILLGFITFLYMFFVVLIYIYLRPITYGFSNITNEQLEKIKLWETWELVL